AVERVGEKALAVAFHGRGGECAHADPGRALVLPQPPHRLGSAQVGHADVHQNQIGAAFDGEGETLDAAGGFERAEPCELENIAREPPVLVVVVDDQDQLIGHGDTSSSTWTLRSSVSSRKRACPQDGDRAGLPRRGGLLSARVLRLRPRAPADRGGVARRRPAGSRRDGGGARARTRAARLRPPAAARSVLDELAAQVEGALDRVRALAGTVYPSILPARGLTDAPRSLGIEEAVYFSCSVLRSHATGARMWSHGAALRLELLGVTEPPSPVAIGSRPFRVSTSRSCET